MLALLEGEGEGVGKEIFGIFMEGHFEVELCVIFFGLPKNKNYEYQRLLHSLPVLLTRLEHWLEVLAKFHLNIGNGTCALSCCIFFTANLVFVCRGTPATEK